MATIGVHVCLIFHQIRLVLVGLRTKESEEMIKAFSGGPMIKWAGIGRLFIWGHTILANRESVVAIVAKNFCNGARSGGTPAIPAGETGGHNRVGKPGFVNGCAVTASQQRGAGRGADRGRMEVRIPQTIGSQSVERRRLDDSAEACGSAKAHIIQKDPHYVWRAGRRFHRFGPPFFGLGEGSADDSLIRLRRLSMQCDTRCNY